MRSLSCASGASRTVTILQKPVTTATLTRKVRAALAREPGTGEAP